MEYTGSALEELHRHMREEEEYRARRSSTSLLDDWSFFLIDAARFYSRCAQLHYEHADTSYVVSSNAKPPQNG
jgi:hypothetical protein